MTDVVKVQIPLITSDPENFGLVYAKGHKHMVQLPLDYAIRARGETSSARDLSLPTIRQWRIDRSPI